MTDAGELAGKVAVVTGAGRGIGQAEAVALAAEGAKVVVNDVGAHHGGEGRDPGPADETAGLILEAGGVAVADYGDVSSMAEAGALVRRALTTFGQLDIVVNNAGNLRTGRIADTSEEAWDSIIANHLKGHFCVSRHAAEVFVSQRSGRIVNTSSEAGLGMPGFGAYGAAKEGITGLTRTLALELDRYGISVNSIRPRAYTRMFPISVQAGIDMGELLTDTLADATSAGLFDNTDAFGPEQVAALVTFLVSDAGAGITGRDFVVGGGSVSLMAPIRAERTVVWEKDIMAERFADLLAAPAVH